HTRTCGGKISTNGILCPPIPPLQHTSPNPAAYPLVPERERSASPTAPPPSRPSNPPLTRRGLGRGPGPRSLSSPPEGWARGSGTPAVGTARGWGYGERVQPGAAAPRRPRFAPPRLFGGTQKEKRWSVGPRPAGRQRPERRGSRSAPGPGQCGDTSVFFLRSHGTKWPPPPRPAPLTLRAARCCANCGPPKHLRVFTEPNYVLSALGETPPRAVAGGLRKVGLYQMTEEKLTSLWTTTHCALQDFCASQNVLQMVCFTGLSKTAYYLHSSYGKTFMDVSSIKVPLY
ncbi:hypothetical protein Nmel_005397, partial [Mimus melanotis]